MQIGCVLVAAEMMGGIETSAVLVKRGCRSVMFWLLLKCCNISCSGEERVEIWHVLVAAEMLRRLKHQL